MFTESYERKLKGNNLILSECGENPEINVFEEHMITENDIIGFLPCKKRNEDGIDKFVYDITSKQSLRQLFEEREMKEADLKKIISGIVSIKEETENYLLSEKNIILNPSFIYADPETRIPSFVFYPYYNIDLQDSLKQLGTFILERTDHNDEKAVILAYGFYKGVINEDYSFEKLLWAGRNEPEGIAGNNNNTNNDNTTYNNIITNDDRKHNNSNHSIGNNRDNTGETDDFDALTVPADNHNEKAVFMICLAILIILTGLLIAAKLYKGEAFYGINGRYVIGLCGLLGALSVSVPSGILVGRVRRDNRLRRLGEIEKKIYSENDRLNRQSNRIKRDRKLGNTKELEEEEMIPKRLVCYEGNDITEFRIDKPSYLIGKSSEEADGILDNPKASRIHAKIQKRNGDFYITDQNSTNGTAVNGHILAANESVKLCVNDEVSFAGKVFYFR